MTLFLLETNLQTKDEAAVEVSAASVEVEAVDRLLQAERIDDLSIDLGVRECSGSQQSLWQVVAQRDVTYLDERGFLEAQQRGELIGRT